MLNTNNNTNNQSIIFKSMDLQQKLQDRRVFDQFLNKTQNQRVTCDKPRGYLVKENPVQMFGSMFVDTAKDVRNLGRAITKGESNDHELGRMNDLGMKLGGGLIAAALMGSKATTNKKLMELLGFGTFFSVMSLWPKVAIDLPTYLMHGFNPHQKYIDSQGRKKQFFQDNQYLPWDVWTKEDINKVADRMGVSKNMKDREEYTKEKMRTIALQGNTLWMLSAGFATPLGTSLICNMIENKLEVPTAQGDLKRLAAAIKEASNGDTIETLTSSELFKQQDESFRQLTDRIKAGKITRQETIEELSNLFNITNMSNADTKGYDFVAKNMPDNQTDVITDLVDRLFGSKEGSNGIKEISEDFITRITEGESDIEVKKAKQLFNEALQSANAEGSTTGESVFQKACNIIRSRRGEFSGSRWARNLMTGKNSDIIDSLQQSTVMGDTLDKSMLKTGADTLETIYKETIKPAQAQVRLFGLNLEKLDQVSGVKYVKTVKQLLKSLNLSNAEITALRNSEDFYGSYLPDTLASHFKKIASDEKAYDSTIEALRKQAEQLEQTTDKSTRFKKAFMILTNQSDDTPSSWGKIIKNALGGSKKESKKLSERIQAAKTALQNKDSNIKTTISGTFDSMSETLDTKLKNLGDGVEGLFEGAEGSKLSETLRQGLSANTTSKMRANITSVDSMIYRMLGSLDLEKRIQDSKGDTFIQTWIENAKKYGYEGKFTTIDDSNKDEFLNLCRKISWQSTYGDAMNKFHLDGNGNGYRALIETIFPDMSNLGDDVSNWNRCIKDIALNSECIPYPQLETERKQLLHSIKYNQMGQSTLDAIKNQVEQAYNNKTWMKVFGGLAIGVAAVTFISQLFFGKVKDEHLYGKDTFEGGNTNVNKQ